MGWVIYQYRARNGRLPIEEWYEGLLEREKVKFDERISALNQNGPEEFKTDWCPHIRGGIWEVKLKGNKGAQQYRVMSCRGPRDKNSEMTLLFPAAKKGNRLDPRDAVDRAIERMNEVELDSDGRRRKWTKS